MRAGGARCAPPSVRPGGVPRAGANGIPPRRGQDPSLRAIVHGCFVGSGLDRSAGWAGVGELGRRGGIHAARDICGGGNSAGRIYAAPTNRSEKWRLRLICRGGIHAAPTHCPQTVFCMAGRRGRRPLRRLARKRLPAATPRACPLRRDVFLFVPLGANSTFFIIYYLLSLIYLLFAAFVV